MIETAKEAKERIRQRERDNLLISILATKKDTQKTNGVLEKLEIDIKEKQPQTTAEVLNVIHGIHRDLLMALENINRIRRILFKGETHDKK